MEITLTRLLAEVLRRPFEPSYIQLIPMLALASEHLPQINSAIDSRSRNLTQLNGSRCRGKNAGGHSGVPN
jgi:hypothetical protein